MCADKGVKFRSFKCYTWTLLPNEIEAKIYFAVNHKAVLKNSSCWWYLSSTTGQIKKAKKRETKKLINSKTGHHFLSSWWQFWGWREIRIKDFSIRFLEHFQLKADLIFFNKWVNSRTRYFFPPQYQVYHRDKSTEYADIRKQLISSSVFPLKEKLQEVTVAQTQISR